MKPRYIIFLAAIAGMLMLSRNSAMAQQKTPEEQKKDLMDWIEKEIEHLEGTLKLEDWQVFYVDSVYTHDYLCAYNEMQELQKKRVENTDLYLLNQDKWMDKIYEAMHGILDEKQWAKYLKSGADRDKMARDKRKEKIEKAAAKLKEGEK